MISSLRIYPSPGLCEVPMTPLHTAQIPAITCQFRWPPPAPAQARAKHCACKMSQTCLKAFGCKSLTYTAIWVKIRILCRYDDNVYPCFQEIGHNPTTIFWNFIVSHKNTQNCWVCDMYLRMILRRCVKNKLMFYRWWFDEGTKICNQSSLNN